MAVTPPPDGSDLVQLRLQYLESTCVQIQKERKELEESFGRQRKQFIEQMKRMDSELALGRKTIERFSGDVRQLTEQLSGKDQELFLVRKTARASEAVAREAFDADRVKYEEEIAYLKLIIESSREQGGVSDQPVLTDGVRSGSVSPQDSLETSMYKAAEDTKMLRSVVVPLEEEIGRLKAQLSEAHAQLSQKQWQAEDNLSAPLIDLSSPSPVLEPAMEQSSSPSDLQRRLELESTARHDLEMYMQSLQSQKSSLQEEAVRLKADLDKAHKQMEEKGVTITELRQTWELANQHFIVAQDQLKQHAYYLEQRLALALGNITSKPCLQGTLRQRSKSSERMDESGEREGIRRTTSWSSSLHKSHPGGSQELRVFLQRITALQADLNAVQEQLAHKKELCANYEAQMQRVQNQMASELQDKDETIDQLRAENKKYQAGIVRERTLRGDLRRQLDETKEEMRKKVETYELSERALVQAVRSLKESFTETKHDSQHEVAHLSSERVRLTQQVERLQAECLALRETQAKQMEQYQKGLALANAGQAEAEGTVAELVERLGGREEMLSVLQVQLSSEQAEKDHLEDSLIRKLDEAKRKNVDLQKQLEEERSKREEVVNSRAALREKSQAFINEQQQRLEKLSHDKEESDKLVRQLQQQVEHLTTPPQTQCVGTEATQAKGT